jgi:DNA modification methylase
VNALYYGDNLAVLRESIADESVDLIYLDPPFNSKRDYNVLFRTPKGHQSDAQIVAFEDSWQWGPQAEKEYREILDSGNTDAAEVIQSLRRFLGENDMMAYLTMMSNRLIELRRVLKTTGSLYLHCDPTASHYLKIVLDSVFGKENYRNEIIWKRTHSHNDPKRFGTIHDSIFYYAKDIRRVRWFPIYIPYTQEYIDKYFKFLEPDGRRYWTNTLTAPGPRPNLEYPWKGVMPPPGRCWAMEKPKLEELERQGRIAYTKSGFPLRKYYLDEMKGAPAQDIWTDIPGLSGLSGNAAERLHYATQKPLALLERITSASSDIGDVVLDPFCGCGTAIHAAQKLGRAWIGIDITHLAIALVEKRLRDAFPGILFDVNGTPTDFDGARDLALRDKYQFQWWACTLVNAQPYQGKKKGADAGIDGLIYFEDEKGLAKKVIVSVKGGENITLTMLKDLIATVQGEKAQIGMFVTLTPPTKPMVKEAARAGFYDSPLGVSYPKIQILTVEGLLNGTERPEYPLSTGSGGVTFKRAKPELKDTKQRDLFEKARSEVDALPLSAFIPPEESDEPEPE